MKVKQKGHTTIISTSENELAVLEQKIQGQYASSFAQYNLIVDLTSIDQISQDDLLLFEPLAIEHMEKANKSFVLVVLDADYNEFDADLVIVPSLQEAHDIIEMDEIQRDLGF